MYRQRHLSNVLKLPRNGSPQLNPKVTVQDDRPVVKIKELKTQLIYQIPLHFQLELHCQMQVESKLSSNIIKLGSSTSLLAQEPPMLVITRLTTGAQDQAIMLVACRFCTKLELANRSTTPAKMDLLEDNPRTLVQRQQPLQAMLPPRCPRVNFELMLHSNLKNRTLSMTM